MFGGGHDFVHINSHGYIERYLESFLNIFLLLENKPRLFPLATPSFAMSGVRTGLGMVTSLLKTGRERPTDDDAGDSARESGEGMSE